MFYRERGKSPKGKGKGKDGKGKGLYGKGSAALGCSAAPSGCFPAGWRPLIMLAGTAILDKGNEPCLTFEKGSHF